MKPLYINHQDAELSELFDWESTARRLSAGGIALDELVDGNYKFSNAEFLDSVTRLLIIYNYYKRGHGYNWETRYIINAVKCMPNPSFRLAAIDYLARDVRFPLNCFESQSIVDKQSA